MAQTTTAVNACDAAVWLDDAAGVQRDISGSSNVVTINFDNDIGEVQTFGSNWKIRLECGQDASFEIVAVYSTTTNEAVDILKNWFFGTRGDRSLSIYIPDKDVGSDHYSAEVKLDDWEFTASHDDPAAIAVTMRLLPNRAVTWTTAST